MNVSKKFSMPRTLTNHTIFTLLNSSHLQALSPTWTNPPTTIAQSISYPEDASPKPLKRSDLSQMHRYYIYNKYFVQKLITHYLY